MSAPIHSKLPPSAASRWTECPASVGFIEANASILPKEGGVFAAEGTLAHAVAGHLLGKGPMPTKVVPPEMLGYAKDYAEFVLSKKEKDTDRLLVERRVPLYYLPEQAGTVDAALFSQKSLYISDFKYGAGVSVEAQNNKQMAIYAESLIQELSEVEDIPDDTLIVMAIYQPRDRSNPEPVRLWAISRADLRAFTAPFGEIAKKILANEPGLPFKADPDAQCRFCPAKGICKHYGSYGLQALPGASVEAVDQLVLPDPTTLTREQRIKIIAARKPIEAFLEAVENQEVTELMAGAAPMGLKLVAGKTNRVWTNEEEADKLLSNHLTAEQRRKPWEVLSVAQAEKALKGIELSTRFSSRMAELVTRPPGRPSLVPVADKRPALEFDPTAGLTAIVEDSDVV